MGNQDFTNIWEYGLVVAVGWVLCFTRNTCQVAYKTLNLCWNQNWKLQHFKWFCCQVEDVHTIKSVIHNIQCLLKCKFAVIFIDILKFWKYISQNNNENRIVRKMLIQMYNHETNHTITVFYRTPFSHLLGATEILVRKKVV